MMDKTQLTESERIQLKMMVLEKKKEQLENEINTIKKEKNDIEKKKTAVNQMVNYFKNWWWE